MIRKGIFGGTFDPIHNGHLNIAYEALYCLNLDEIYFMPTGNPPHKSKKCITSANLRYEMVKMAIRNESRFCVCDYEIKKDTMSYTFETTSYFKNKERNTEWYFITGADCLASLDKWRNIKGIFENCNLVVFNRKGYNNNEILSKKKYIEDKYDTIIYVLEAPTLEISSTELRNKINEGKRVDYLIPHSVYNTILALNLYKDIF